MGRPSPTHRWLPSASRDTSFTATGTIQFTPRRGIVGDQLFPDRPYEAHTTPAADRVSQQWHPERRGRSGRHEEQSNARATVRPSARTDAIVDSRCVRVLTCDVPGVV